MDQETREYLERRERMERAAAKNATCPEARRVHQQLAQEYVSRIRRQQDAAEGPAGGPPPRPTLSIVAGSGAGA